MTVPQRSPGSLAFSVVFAVACGAALSHCGRVSYIEDGMEGDAGQPVVSSSSRGGGSTSSSGGTSTSQGGNSSSAAVSSSSSGGGSNSSNGGAGCPGQPQRPDAGPPPEYDLVAEDFTAEFDTAWTGGNPSNCAGCHAGVGTSYDFSPVFPTDRTTDPARAVNSFRTYCTPWDGTVPSPVQPDGGLHKARIICPLLPLEAGSDDLCSHGAGFPVNNQTLDDVRNLALPCINAADRYWTAYGAWQQRVAEAQAFDAGPCILPDAGGGASSSSGGGVSSSGGGGSTSSSGGGALPDCPGPDTYAAYNPVWDVFGPPGEICLGCHTPGGHGPVDCFLGSSRNEAHATMCGYRYQDDRTSVGPYESSMFYRAMYEDARYNCPSADTPHSGFYESDPNFDAVVRAWYAAATGQ
ncbi:MAG: hypothetical protein AB2A00_33010 [Myxococcota bacterium]